MTRALAAAVIGLVCLAAPAQAATRTFSNATSLQPQIGQTSGPLLPYPSVIAPSGVPGAVSAVRVSIHGISSADTDNLAMILVGPGERRALVLQAACNGQNTSPAPLSVTFTDDAVGSMPQTGTCVSGTFKPTVYGASQLDFGHPLPDPPYPTALSAFAGASPNGVWGLYAQDIVLGGPSAVTGGWSLELTTTDVKKCKKGKGKRAAAPKKKRCKKRKKK